MKDDHFNEPAVQTGELSFRSGLWLKRKVLKMNRMLIGCVGDDFTGSSDAASFIAQEGMKTLLFNGTPKEKLPDFTENIACVIALKTDRKSVV